MLYQHVNLGEFCVRCFRASKNICNIQQCFKNPFIYASAYSHASQCTICRGGHEHTKCGVGIIPLSSKAFCNHHFNTPVHKAHNQRMLFNLHQRIIHSKRALPWRTAFKARSEHLFPLLMGRDAEECLIPRAALQSGRFNCEPSFSTDTLRPPTSKI